MAVITSFEQTISTAVNAAIKERINELVEAEVKKAQDKIARMVPEIVAGIAINLQSQMSFERMGSDLRITIRMEK